MAATSRWLPQKVVFERSKAPLQEPAIPLVTFIVTNYTTKTSGREGIIAHGLVVLLLHGNVQAMGCLLLSLRVLFGGRVRYLLEIE